ICFSYFFASLFLNCSLKLFLSLSFKLYSQQMKSIKTTIIAIGDELLLGQTIDTNSVWLAHQLNDAGIWVNKRIVIGDTAGDILQTLERESKEADIILITGGLGPTDDDKTKKVL